MTAERAAARSDDGRAAARPIRIGMLVGSVGETGGGVPASVRDLALALRRTPGIELTVYASAQSGADAARDAWAPVKLDIFPIFGPSTFGYARGLDRALELADLDLLHVHGLWMYISIAARRWAHRTGRPYLVSPHGMLDPWALTNSGWKKAAALRAYERSHLDGAVCLHALCEAEWLAIRSFGLTNPVVVVPNGVGLSEAPRSTSPAGERRTLLFLGRLHPKKGLLALVDAWAKAKAHSSAAAWDLEIAGMGSPDFVAGLRALVADLGVSSSVRFVGHRSGDDKARTFEAADAFILPSISEGQPLAVLEAWAQGLPVLITPQCNLMEGVSAGAAIEIGSTPDDIAAGLGLLFDMPEARRLDMGRKGRDLAATSFSWANAADLWSGIYRRIAYASPERSSVFIR